LDTKSKQTNKQTNLFFIFQIAVCMYLNGNKLNASEI
jgi:hypothetical protein